MDDPGASARDRGSPVPEELAAAFAATGLPAAQRHLFFCIGPDCCATADGEATWQHAKRRLREAGLPVLRTKAACLRLCQRGPWLVVYPEGVWYEGVTPGRFDRILAEHLHAGRPVAEWARAVHPLPARLPEPPPADV